MKKILVVDDDANTAEVLTSRLKVKGYEMLTAADPLSGLELAMECKPDLVIVDICMAVGGGFFVAYRLRERVPAVPVILVTARKQAGLREMATDLGAVGFIEDPCQSDDLLAAVTLVLQGSSPWPGTPEQPPEPQAPAHGTATTGSHCPVTHPDTPRPPARITGRNKILIVEDDRKIAMALTLRLRAAGQDVLMAYDAASALSSAIKNQPDLVLLDIGLPAGSGLLVAERIRILVPKLIPIIFLTASRRPGLREEAMALGAAGFLEKPYEADELIAAIQRALNPCEDS